MLGPSAAVTGGRGACISGRASLPDQGPQSVREQDGGNDRELGWGSGLLPPSSLLLLTSYFLLLWT